GGGAPAGAPRAGPPCGPAAGRRCAAPPPVVAPASSGPRPAAGEIRRLAAVARPWLAGAVITGLGQAVLLTAQAAVLAGLLATAMRHQLTVRLTARDALLITGF